MLEAIVFGFMPWSLTDENSGELRSGYSYHLAFVSPSTTANFHGSEVRKISVNQNVYDSWVSRGDYIPDVQDHVYVIFDMRGRIVNFLPVTK